MRIILYILVLLFGGSSLVVLGNNITDQSALTLSKVPLYKSPDLSCPDFIVLPQGTLVEVVGQSETLHLDKDQLQQFYWYEVHTTQNENGWIYGNNLAVITMDPDLLALGDNLHKTAVDFGSNYGLTTAWAASILGRDTGEYISNVYREDYLIFTHTSGRSVWQKIARTTYDGSNKLLQILLKDVTNDKYPELLLCSAVHAENMPENTKMEVFKMQNSRLVSIFSEDLTLRLPNGDPSPAISKCVDLEEGSIRIEYIDMMVYKDASAPANGQQQYSLEYVTYTYSWNMSKGNFELLYPPSRMAPRVLASAASVRLYASPDIHSAVADVVGTNKSMKVLSLITKYTKNKHNDKQMEVFYFVQSANGIKGFVPSWNISFTGIRHEAALNAWNAAPPLLPDDWTYPMAIIQY